MNADQKLDDVALKQYAWKNERLREACRRIAVHAASVIGYSFWPDEIYFDDFAKENANCIGTAYRVMSKVHGLIEKGSCRRRSKTGNSNGREIAIYYVRTPSSLMSFIRANKWDTPQPHAPQMQQEML